MRYIDPATFETYTTLMDAIQAAWPMSHEGLTLARALAITNMTWDAYLASDHSSRFVEIVLERAGFVRVN